MSILKNVLTLAKAKKPKTKRSSRWATVRAKHLKDHPACAVCGETKNLEVHHIHPFHDAPELELDPTNLVTLCECASHGIVCHLNVGHCGNYRSYNPNVITDAKYISEMLKHKVD